MKKRMFAIAHQKGLLAEGIIENHLNSKGWVVYPAPNESHAFDFLAVKNMKHAIALDVKAKARMNKYPATGIDTKYYNIYKNFSGRYNMPFWVVFVDEMQQTVYGNCLTELDRKRIVDGKQYPFELNSIRIWPLEAMIHIANINDDDSEKLKELNQRTHDYEPEGGKCG